MLIEEMKETCDIFLRNKVGDWFSGANHDIIHGPDYDLTKRNCSPKDFKRLEELGWFKGDYDTLDHVM
jgi:hypothetical protein